MGRAAGAKGQPVMTAQFLRMEPCAPLLRPICGREFQASGKRVWDRQQQVAFAMMTLSAWWRPSLVGMAPSG